MYRIHSNTTCVMANVADILMVDILSWLLPCPSPCHATHFPLKNCYKIEQEWYTENMIILKHKLAKYVTSPLSLYSILVICFSATSPHPADTLNTSTWICGELSSPIINSLQMPLGIIFFFFAAQGMTSVPPKIILNYHWSLCLSPLCWLVLPWASNIAANSLFTCPGVWLNGTLCHTRIFQSFSAPLWQHQASVGTVFDSPTSDTSTNPFLPANHVNKHPQLSIHTGSIAIERYQWSNTFLWTCDRATHYIFHFIYFFSSQLPILISSWEWVLYPLSPIL